MQVSAIAATKIETVAAEGVGDNREEAIFDALGEGVRQVRGAEISTSRQVKSALSRMSVRTNDGREANIEIQSRTSGSTKVASQGLIKGYRIKSIENISEGRKRAKLDVDIPVYRSPGDDSNDGRWRMAVYPLEVPRKNYVILNHRLGRKEVSARMTHQVKQALVQSRRFAMLARDRDTAIERERQRITSDNVPISEKAMLGNELGAEYVVTGQITDFNVDETQTTSSLTGESFSSAKGALVMDVSVLVPATGKIVWSQTFNLPASTLGVSGRSKSDLQKLFEQGGQQVALAVIDAVWPPIVEGREGNQVIINMGGELIDKGQRWEAFELGDNVDNSHTGRSLGRTESRVATVEIVRSTPTMAYAKVVDGEIDGKGQVLRRISVADKKDKSHPERGTRERTCLPMDEC
ncbi:flagella assembly protein FlgT middle domain-containing protein [Salinivibrio kushneri]|uniref:flagella assembly protein FlgT middle domain-containing protein n=1 Tax=Salinivibrio kushneri TaxID=1908198 RepID=UPI0022B53DE4|nr:flagella assembly protein FlgT middle domain-containing protein [Salinivibrio kushneri]WBA18266.1 hypothetical protein O4598_01880 [Salinivibrio kushneri]